MTGENVDAAAAVARREEVPGPQGHGPRQGGLDKRQYQWNDGSHWDGDARRAARAAHRLNVVAYDFGIKRNILRMLADHGCRVDGGAGADAGRGGAGAAARRHLPVERARATRSRATTRSQAIKEFLETDVPMFGICLGHQLLGLAAGARTVKMKFGHHGANHPVQEVDSGRVLITSQNHGFAVDESTLPANVRVTHRSLFDGSLQGIEFTDRAAFSFQGHPEASPGRATSPTCSTGSCC